ncbi:MAG: hypothetical protein C0622_14705 [Desulfuromonas sp.]|nr:MAG: hypothetical protein C0622_14705 [Desulfuromonas sp.]
MATDYKSLSNEDLTLYYYQLDDQIVIVEQPRSKPRLGLGFGLGGSHIGGGVGVSTGVGSDNVATDLRERRNQVRLELQQRGITP